MKKILIVDDSETIRLQVARALEEAGFTPIEARDGVEGIEQVETHPDVAMILLDVNMPRLNGLDMLDRLRGLSAAQRIPVLMLTTEAQQSMIARAKSAGARGWVIKPVKIDLLMQAVTRLAS